MFPHQAKEITAFGDRCKFAPPPALWNLVNFLEVVSSLKN